MKVGVQGGGAAIANPNVAGGFHAPQQGVLFQPKEHHHHHAASPPRDQLVNMMIAKNTTDLSSRTSLTLCDSWENTSSALAQQYQQQGIHRTTMQSAQHAQAPSSISSDAGVDLPVLLQQLLGVTFLPFTHPTTILEEEDVPRSVEITDAGAEEEDEIVVPPAVVSPPSEESASASSFHREPVHALLPAEETKELQDLIMDRQQHQRQSKKKKAARRFKAAARAILPRFGSVKKRRASSHKAKAELSVDTSMPPCPMAALYQQQESNKDAHTKWISPTVTNSTDVTELPSPFHGGEAATAGCSTSGNVTKSSEAQEVVIQQQQEAQQLLHQVEHQEKHVQLTQHEIEQSQSKLAASISKYQSQLASLQETQTRLQQLARQSSTSVVTPTQAQQITSKAGGGEVVSLPAAFMHHENHNNNEKPQRSMKRSESGSFIRVHDLMLVNNKSSEMSGSSDGDQRSLSSLSHSVRSGHPPSFAHHQRQPSDDKTPDFLLVDHYLLDIIQQLMRLGYELATDEGDRFTPTRDTAKLIAKIPPTFNHNSHSGWSIEPWTPAYDQHILIWTGYVSHEGFGHAWPVVKGRAILHTSARNVLEYLWNSKLVHEYNQHCQGRKDLYTIQDDVEMKAHESPYGFAGCAKIVESINKHRLLPKAIQMKILLHARPLEEHEGSYILVSRSVWENDTATLDSNTCKSVIRTEMLLGCNILRALDDKTCEMTQMSHIYSPGVPRMMAQQAAPTQCWNLMRALQSCFPPP